MAVASPAASPFTILPLASPFPLAPDLAPFLKISQRPPRDCLRRIVGDRENRDTREIYFGCMAFAGGEIEKIAHFLPTRFNSFLPVDADGAPGAVVGRDVGDDLVAGDGQHKAAVVGQGELVVLVGGGVAQGRPVVVVVGGREPKAETELKEKSNYLQYG